MIQSLTEHAAAIGERGEATVATDMSYLPGEPVRVLARKRGNRYDISDDGRAIALAGKPAGWRAAAQRVVDDAALNLARDGRVFVPAVEGRDLDALAARVAETSLEVYDAVLDLEG